MVAQPLPITGRRGLEVDAASALVAASEQRADEAVRQVRAALRRAYADLVGAQLRETENDGVAGPLARTRRDSRAPRGGRRRGRLRPLRAEREVIEIEADMAAARADRARAQAALAAFFAPTTDPPRSSPWSRSRRVHAAAPDASRNSSLTPEVTLPELAALKQRKQVSRIRNPRGRAASHSRTRDRRRHQVVEPRRRRRRECLQRPHHGSALRSCEARTGPGASETRSGRGAHRGLSDVGAARRSSRSARLCSNGDRPPTVIGRRRRPAPHSSNESLRSATTPASAAFSNWSTPIETAVQHDCGRSRSTRRCVTQKSSSNL